MAIADLNTLDHEIDRDFHGNMSLGFAGLVEGTNSATIKTTYAVSFRIGGQTFYKAATDNIAMTACTVQAVDTVAYYLVTINAAGTVKLTKGADDSTTLPDCPDNQAVLGVLKIATDATHPFTSGTSDITTTTAATATWAHLNWFPADADASALTFA